MSDFIVHHVGALTDIFAMLGALFALWKGGAAERSAAAVVILNEVIGKAGLVLAPDAESTIRLVNDGLTALILLAITIRYSALWMGGVMLFYAVQFTLHSFYLVTGRIASDFLHAAVNDLDFSGIILCLVIGTVVVWRRRIRLARAASAPAD